MSMIGDVIGRMAKRTDEISTEAFAGEMEAWKPEGEGTGIEWESLVGRNVGQVGRLIDDATDRLQDVTDVIAAAQALKLELETSLAAWKAAQAVLTRPSTALADKIEAAAEETRKAPIGRPWGAKKENKKLTRFANGVDWDIETVSDATGRTIAELVNMTDDQFANFTADMRPGKIEPTTLIEDDPNATITTATK